MDDFTSNYLKKRAAFLGGEVKAPSQAASRAPKSAARQTGGGTDSFTQNYLKKRAQLQTVTERLGAQDTEAARKATESRVVRGDFSGSRESTQGQSGPNWGKIAGGTVWSGLQDFAQGAAATLAAAEGLVSKPLGAVLGNDELYKDGLFYAWNERIKEEQEQTEEQLAPEYQKAGKAGELIERFGPSTVAAIPQAALAFFTAGQSLAAQGTTAALQGASAAAQGAGIVQTVSTAMQQAARNPQFWASFMATAGNAYEQAKSDGADDVKAYAYGTITGLLNSLVEIGGGIDVLPDGNKRAVREWVESMLDEGKEEVIQGAISQLSQAALYGKDNPLFSTEDENAVINPARAAEEFLGGAVVGGILGGGQIAVQRGLNALGEAGVRAGRGQLQAPAQAQTQRQERAPAPAESDGGLVLTMPEELAEPGDWQSVQARQRNVENQVRQRINDEEGAIRYEENAAGGIGGNGPSKLDPGGQAAGVPGPAGAAQSGRGQGYRARDLGAALDAADVPLIPARQFFGDQSLSEDSYVRELPQDMIDADEGLRTVAQRIRDTGYTPRLYSGAVRQAGGNLQVNGMVSDTEVFIRADSVRYTPEQIWDHETYHIAADQNPGLVRQTAARLMRDFGPDIPNEVLARYIEAYKGVYTGRELTTAAMEEMLADAYAGKDTFRADVSRFSDTVRQMAPQTTQETAQARGPPRYTFGGTRAVQADLQALERAQAMERQGVDAETIRKDTGWFRGADQKWRFEIDDSGMAYSRWGDLRREDRAEYERFRELEGKFISGTLTEQDSAELRGLIDEGHGTGRAEESGLLKLADFIQHDELFENYPQLKNTTLAFVDLRNGARGQYDPTMDVIALDRSLRGEPEDVLIHEIQHAIQQKEGFAGGSSPEYWKSRRTGGGEDRTAAELYQNTAGEIEARDAAARRTLSAEQRRETAPNTGDENTVFADLEDRINSLDREYGPNAEEAPAAEEIDTEENIRRAAEMEPVAEITGKEFPKGETDLVTQVENFFNRQGNRVYNQQIGEIVLDRRGIKSDIAHGIGRKKAAAFAAVADVLEKGQVIDYQKNWKGRGYDTAVVAAPITINGEPYLMGVVAVKSSLSNRFYLHEVLTEKDGAAPFKTGTQNNLGDPGGDTPSILSILDKVREVKRNTGTNRYSAEADVRAGAETETDTEQDQEAETLRRLADLMPGVSRKEIRAIVDDIKGGAIDAQLMADFWDVYDKIRVADYTADAQELQEVRRSLQGRKIYTDESLKAEFGDDWNEIRKKAFGNRLYFTSKRGNGVSGLDQINQELAGQFPQLFNEADTDPTAIMDNILTALDRSRENNISLDEEAARYGGSEAVTDFRQSYVNRFLDIARDYRDYLDGVEETRRAERQAARDAERKRLDDYVARARDVLRRRYIEGDYSVPALALRTIDEDGKAMDFDDYVRRKEVEARAKREERLRHIPKEDFKGSKNLERLGVKIDGTVTDYFGAEGLRANDQAMRAIKKELRAAEKRLRATAKEKSFASKIVSGEFTEADIPATVDRDKVMELADYYMAERAAGTGMIQQRRQDINRLLDERMKALFKDAPDNKLPGAITLNHRTPERVMLSAFGDKAGKKINQALIEPVKRNEAERIRFLNRELDKVRTFEDSTGRQSKLNKAERAAVQQTIEGKAAEEILAGMGVSEAIKRVGENLKAGESAQDLQLEFPLSESERKLARQYARWLEAQEAMAANKVDAVKVENAARKYSELFDQYYEAINDFLVVHGYQPIGFIKGYAPHLQPQEVHSTLSNVMRSMGLLDDLSEIPTSIAGLTGDFRPSKRWNPFFLTRQTENAQQDIVEGFESYIQYLSDVLYHTDDIMRIRSAERYFRKTYAPEDIRAQLEQAEDLRWMPQEDKEAFLRENGVIAPGDRLTGQQVHQALQDYIDQQYRTLEEKGKYSNLVPWFQNYANILAGKQTWADRSWESSVGRRGMNVANRIIRALTRSQIAGNISTVLNQTAQLPQIIAEAGTINTAQAIKDMASGRLKRTGFSGESDFLTSKKGVNFQVDTPGEMVVSALFKPASFMDEMISTLAARSGYLKAIKEGKSDAEAMRYADSFAEKVMGSRARGSRPLAFENKNILSQMVHLYQIEALNSWEHITQDLPRDFREIERSQGKEKAALALAGVIVKMLFSAFLVNRVAEETYGGTPAPYDILGMSANFIASGEGLTANQWLLQLIDDGAEKIGGERIFGTTQGETQDFDWSAAADDAAYQVMGDLPLVRNVAGLLGMGDQTQVWSGLGDAVTNTGKAIAEDGIFSGRTAEELFLLAAQLLPGGNQARKTYQGAKALIQGGRIYGYGDDARMQYAVEQSPANIARGLLFGQSALPESREFYAGGAEGGLSAKQTQVVGQLVEAGADNQDAFDVVQEIQEESGTVAKLQELAEAPWDDSVKEIAAESFMGESQFARYQAALRANVSTLAYSDFLTDAYQHARKRTGKDDASPSQADVEAALDKSGLTRMQKRAIWNSYGWKKESPW